MTNRTRGLMAAAGRNPYRAALGDSRAPVSRVPRLVAVSGAAVDYLHRHWTDRLDEVLHVATAEAGFRFRVLSTEISGSPAVDWHTDPQSGVAWPVRFHTGYRYGDMLDRARPSDVKIPWELSRLQCLPRFSLAFRLTGDQRYIDAARAILRDWDDANPVGYGINWTVGMEASLRAISIIVAQELLVGGTGGRLDLADGRWRELLAEHGRFIYRNMEYSDVNGNHLTSCLLGLLYLGAFAPWDREASAWVDYAVDGLHIEIEAQTYPDGVCHEGSIPYHGLVAELFLHALLVGERCGLDFSAGYRDRLYRMLTFTRAYLKPGDNVPMWGDADDGRVISLGGDLGEHHRSLLALGATLLRRDDLWKPGERVPLAAALLLRPEHLPKGTGAGDRCSSGALRPGGQGRRADVGSAAFRDGGFFVLRRDAAYALIDCGDVGLRGRGGHGHNDALSVELTLAGSDVLVDTGCASYTRSAVDRVSCMGAKAHNAVVIADHEPAPIDLARIPHAGPCPVEAVAFDADAVRFVGRHFGYRPVGVERYERTVELPAEPGSAIIADELWGHGTRHARWFLHLGPDWHKGRIEPTSARFEHAGGDRSQLQIRWQMEKVRARLTSSPMYTSYASSASRACLVLEAEMMLPATARIHLRVGPTPLP